jgi:hypothetical protein
MKWHKGPPPSIGWWPASFQRDTSSIRYWNGRWWSLDARQYHTAKYAARRAEHEAVWQEGIQWTDRPANWPERSKT